MVKRSQKSQVEGRKSKLLQLIVCLLTFNCGLATALPGPQPQAQRGQPIHAANARYVNGPAPGCCGLLVHSFVDFNFHVPANAAWFAVCVALSTCYAPVAGTRSTGSLPRPTGRAER